MEKIPNLSTFFNGYDDLDLFFLSLSNDDSKRLIYWLLTFEIIGENNSLDRSFKKLESDFLEKTHRIFDDSKDYLSFVDKEQSHTIKADIDRSIRWFKQSSQDLNLNDDLLKQCYDLAIKIFSFSSRTEYFKYVQGYDRYLFLCLYLSLKFSLNYNLNFSIVEALTFHLTYSFIKLSNSIISLENQKEITNDFNNLDLLIKKYSPNISNLLNNVKFSSIYFAFSWKLLSFADLHNFSDSFIIWDIIIYYRFDLKNIMNSLCLSHLIQSLGLESLNDSKELNISLEELTNNIQHNKNWNISNLISNTLNIYLKIRNQINLPIKLSFFFLILIYFYLIFKNLK